MDPIAGAPGAVSILPEFTNSSAISSEILPVAIPSRNLAVSEASVSNSDVAVLMVFSCFPVLDERICRMLRNQLSRPSMKAPIYIFVNRDL